MSSSLISRRSALSFLSALPFAGRASGQTRPAGARRIISGGLWAYIIETDGAVQVWSFGPNGTDGGTLGLGFEERVTPWRTYPVPGLRDVVTIASGSAAAFALLASGNIVSWGAGSRGSLGTTPLSELEVTATSRTRAKAPTPVLGIVDAVDISATSDHALALARNGTIYAWGFGAQGQLGIGPMPVINFKTHSPAPMDFVPFPVRIPGLADVIAIAAGHDHSLALVKDGTIRAWGGNRWGQIGDGTVIDRRSPVVVPGIRKAKAIAAGGNLSAAVLDDGLVMTWGLGNSGLGRKALKCDTPYPTPALVEGVTGIRTLAIGSIHMLGLTDAGTIISWGDSSAGEVGHNGTAPQQIPGLSNVQSIAANTGRSYAVLAGGKIMTWGMVPLWARVDGGDPGVSHTPIPLVIKGLSNP